MLTLWSTVEREHKDGAHPKKRKQRSRVGKNDGPSRFSKIKVLVRMALPGWRVEMTPAKG